MGIYKIFASVLTLISLTAVVGLASDALSLKENMKQIETLYKAIGNSVNDSSKNADNAKAAAEITELFKVADTQIPEIIKEMPAGDQPAATSDYQKMISNAIELSKKMEEAFIRNDNTAAAEAHKQLKALRREGHDKYRPE